MMKRQKLQNTGDYEKLLEAEGKYWDRVFIEQTESDSFRCFFHHCAYFQKLTQRYIRTIWTMADKESAVLEVGCGYGWLALLMAQTGARVTGIDIAERCLAAAQAKAREDSLENCSFQYLDLNTDPLPANSYDLIVSWGSLHHIQNMDWAAEQIYQALKPEGKLVLVECVEQKGIRGKLAHILADFFHFILPTDRSYLTKIKYGFRKLFGGKPELEWSPFERAGSGEWHQTVLSRFTVIHEEAFMGFLSPFVTRQRLPERFLNPIVAALATLDSVLVKLHILPPEYYFMILQKRPA